MIHPENAFPVISYFNHILFAILFPFRPCTSFLYIQQILITVSVPSSAAPGYLIREDSPDKLYHFPLARREIKIPRIIFPSLKPASVHIISRGRFYLSLSQHPVANRVHRNDNYRKMRKDDKAILRPDKKNSLLSFPYLYSFLSCDPV